MSELRFNDRVVVVTGAGAGLGRAYAILFGARGAKVVVNDLGGGRHGDGKSSMAADAVVKEIKDKGGIAVADYNSVVEGDKIIQTALEAFGRVDVLVNNAGILRDKSFPRISDQDWDLIHAVHLKGSYKTTQAAWPIFKKQNYGRIIMTASNSGIYGNFGQANYSAAKLGLVGLANTLTIEGRKNNIHCNVIVPTAASRLTEDILPPDLFEELRPELIAPVVVYLCHESCQDSGSIIDTAVGWAAKVHMVRGQGTHLRQSIKDNVTPEMVRDSWSKVVDMSKAQRLTSIEDATGELMTQLQALKEGGDDSYAEDMSIDVQDYILYALAVGATVTEPEDLKLLYEGHSDFTMLPTYLVSFMSSHLIGVLTSDVFTKQLPNGEAINPANVLHGEQYLEMCDSLPTSAIVVKCKSYIVDLLDKGSGMLAIVGTDLLDSNGNKIATSQTSIFVVGRGGFGGPRTSAKAIESVPVPDRKPDTVVEQKTTKDQAALYRLVADRNPLHIDPSFAAIAGFKTPILHGLCSFGFSVRHVIARYGNNDPSQLKAVKARFAKPVLPGETLQTKMWQQGNRIHFQTAVKETGNVVINGAYVDLKSVSAMPIRSNPVSAAALSSDAVFTRIQEGIKVHPDKAKAINGVFLYHITQDGKKVKQWTVDLKNMDVYEGEPKGVKVDTTLTIADSDMVELALGKLNPQVAFMKGKLKITGNIMLTQKLVPLLKLESKL